MDDEVYSVWCDGQSTREVVQHPSHYYTAGGIECIDYLRAKLTADEYRGFLRGNAIKYLDRLGRKGLATNDARKALQYCTWLVKALEEGDKIGSDNTDCRYRV